MCHGLVLYAGCSNCQDNICSGGGQTDFGLQLQLEPFVWWKLASNPQKVGNPLVAGDLLQSWLQPAPKSNTTLKGLLS
jgi:hypothetical protein